MRLALGFGAPNANAGTGPSRYWGARHRCHYTRYSLRDRLRGGSPARWVTWQISSFQISSCVKSAKCRVVSGFGPAGMPRRDTASEYLAVPVQRTVYVLVLRL